eukprot:2725615-Pyramimonas_sp.AAC.2
MRYIPTEGLVNAQRQRGRTFGTEIGVPDWPRTDIAPPGQILSPWDSPGGCKHAPLVNKRI